MPKTEGLELYALKRLLVKVKCNIVLTKKLKKKNLKRHLTVCRYIIQCFLGNDLQGSESYTE